MHTNTFTPRFSHITRAQRPTLERRPGTPPTPEFGIQHAHSNVTYHFPEID